jgi:hypothetical protein
VTDLAKAQFFLLLASLLPCNFQIPLSLSDFSPLCHPRSFTLCPFFPVSLEQKLVPVNVLDFFLWDCEEDCLQCRQGRTGDPCTGGSRSGKLLYVLKPLPQIIIITTISKTLYTHTHKYIYIYIHTHTHSLVITIKCSMNILLKKVILNKYFKKLSKSRSWAVPPKSEMKHQRIFKCYGFFSYIVIYGKFPVMFNEFSWNFFPPSPTPIW